MDNFSAIFEDLLETDSFHIQIEDVNGLTQAEKNAWSSKHSKYSCIIENNDKSLHVDFYSCTWPEDESILYAVVSDAEAGVHKSFDDFCCEYGYDNDSIKALRTYEKCQQTKTQLIDVFGDELATRLIECEKDL